MNSDDIKVLVFRIGQLGDILVSVPALWAVREHFKDAKITLLSDDRPKSGYVRAVDVLDGSGIVDDFLGYDCSRSGTNVLEQSRQIVRILRELRAKEYDTLVYLPPSRRGKFQIYRDKIFFSLAGIKQFLAMDEFPDFPKKLPSQPLPAVLQEGDLLLQRLRKSGIKVPEAGKGRVDVNITEKEFAAIERWLSALLSDDGRAWIAIGPGSKMPLKIWPKERYVDVVQKLIGDFDIWPVVFGGPDDVELGKYLTSQWKRGYIAAGSLKVREAIAAMSKCAFYIGNDTGVMHMATAAGIPCVAIYSARDYPGNWEPYGQGHTIFRKRVPCEGCMLRTCTKHKAKCITAINTREVYQACKNLLTKQLRLELTNVT